MKYIKATTTDGKTELFNLDQVLTLTPNGEQTKILMGAGLYWNVQTDSIIFIDGFDNLKIALKGVKK